jgi:hypothetical protein
MRMYMGAVIAILGLVLFAMGLDSQDSLTSRLSKMFTGSPTDKTIWLLMGGALAMAFGVGTALSGRNGGERLS